MIALGFQPVFNMPRAREHYINIIYVEYTFGLMKRAKQHPCLAGLAPASHPVKRVGTQRVALNKTSMRLRVKARKDTEGEPVDTYMQHSKWTCEGKRQFCSSKKG